MLIANERKDRLAIVAPVVTALGHEVIAREIEGEDVGAVTARERPDVALVGLGASSQHALDLIDKIVREAACPVIVLLHAPDPGFINEASKRGVFEHISDADVDDWQSAIDIVLRRFKEYHELQGAFGRRVLTERATGILMERHSIDVLRAIRRWSQLDGCPPTSEQWQAGRHASTRWLEDLSALARRQRRATQFRHLEPGAPSRGHDARAPHAHHQGTGDRCPPRRAPRTRRPALLQVLYRVGSREPPAIQLLIGHCGTFNAAHSLCRQASLRAEDKDAEPRAERRSG